MPNKVSVTVVGNEADFAASLRRAGEQAAKFDTQLKRVAVDSRESARVQVRAEIAKQDRLQASVRAYEEVAAAAKVGSREQVAATNLAVKANARLTRSITGASATVARSSREHGRRSAGLFGRRRSHATGLIGGGLFGGLVAAPALEGIIEAGAEAAATQRQLSKQLSVSGLSFADYRDQIERTNMALSGLSGFTGEELDKSFLTLFRATNNVSRSLRINQIAADAARGTHKSLATVSLALAKAYNGQTTGLRRLGILVPKNLHGMEALNYVGRKFAGQARAGSTAQQRLAAAFHNSQVIIGQALLPSVTRLANGLARYLTRLNRTGQLQRTVQQVMRVAASAAHALGDAFRVIRAIVVPLNHALGGTRNSVRLLIGAFVAFKALKVASSVAQVGRGLGLVGRGARAARFAATGLRLAFAGPVGLVIAAGLAAFALTTLILKVTRLDKRLKVAGASAFNLAASLGLVNDPMGKYKGKLVPGQASTRFLRNRAARLEARGMTPTQAAARLVATHPNLAKRDAETIAGVRGSRPVAHSSHYYVENVHANDPDQFVEKVKRKAKKGVAQRRGPRAGASLGLN